MALRIYNTLTRKKEEFVPLTPGRVGIYVCGVTVYDFSHVGHARSALAFDMIRRYLLFRGYQVKFVRNFTDVDDKIIQRAQREGVTAQEISERPDPLESSAVQQLTGNRLTKIDPRCKSETSSINGGRPWTVGFLGIPRILNQFPTRVSVTQAAALCPDDARSTDLRRK